MGRTEFQLLFFKGEKLTDLPNIQQIFLSEKSAKDSIIYAKMGLLRYGITHYEIQEHYHSYKSNGRKRL